MVEERSIIPASFEELAHADQVSTCPTKALPNPTVFKKSLVSLINPTISSGPWPKPALFRTPLSLIRYKSSLPTLTPTTKFRNASPCVSIAFLRADSSLAMLVVPEHQMPRRRDVFVAMAAGKAESGVVVVEAWMLV